MPSTFESRPSLTADRAIDHPRPGTPRNIGIVVGVLMMIVFAFAGRRLWVDVPNLTAGTRPDQAFDARYVSRPWLTFLSHRGPARPTSSARCCSCRSGSGGITIRLTGGSAGWCWPSGCSAGRPPSPSAWSCRSVVKLSGGPRSLFGALVPGPSLVLAFRAIRAGDAVQHRRWMIRGVRRRCWRRHDPDLDLPAPGCRSGRPGRGLRPRLLDGRSRSTCWSREFWLRRRPVPPDACSHGEFANRVFIGGFPAAYSRQKGLHSAQIDADGRRGVRSSPPGRHPAPGRPGRPAEWAVPRSRAGSRGSVC